MDFRPGAPLAAISALIEAAEAEGPDAAEEVGDAVRAVDGFDREGGHGGLGLRHGLQETAGRQGDDGGPEPHRRRARLVDDLTGQGDAGEVAGGGALSGLDAGVGGKPAAAPLYPGDVDVEAGLGAGDVQGGRRLRMFEKGLGQGGQGRKGRHQRRVGDWADADLDQPPGPPRLEAEGDALADRAGVQGEPAPRMGRACEGGQDLGLDSLAAQGLAHLVGFPGEIGRARPVLQGTAAAIAEVRTGRRNPIGAGGKDRLDLGAVALALGADPLAGQGQGRIDGT